MTGILCPTASRIVDANNAKRPNRKGVWRVFVWSAMMPAMGEKSKDAAAKAASSPEEYA
jgi:hypothetical protein